MQHHQSESQHAPVRWQAEAGTLVVTIDNPPVNALGIAVRRGLLAALEAAARDTSIRAILLLGAGRAFIAGADIREFGKPPESPSLVEVCRAMESSAKPTVTAIHGFALGGGLEIALAAHYRLALAGARLGLPEVTLGLLPGAGGTQRTPRLIGVAAALDLILSGRPVEAEKAQELGLVDSVAAADADPRAVGLRYVQELLARKAPPRRTRDLPVPADAAARAALDQARAALAGKYRGLFSPAKIIEAVAAATELPFDEGMRRERAAFEACLKTPQRKALIHAFFAQRAAARLPELKGVAPRAVARVGVVGGGTMGAGITVAVLDAGLPVTMIERDEDNLARGRAKVEAVYDRLVDKQRMSAAERESRLARYHGSTRYSDLADVDLVIEAVFEDMAVKQAVFHELDRSCKAGAILASNTSYLDIDALAASTSRPQDVIGLHFFSPANIMKLLEVVVPSQVAPEVVASALALGRRLGKAPVRAGVCDGFIGNRMLAVYRNAAEYLMMDGASPYEIDAAIRGFGFPMGPFQVMDLAGGDIGWATRKRHAATRDPQKRYVPIADKLCERGWFGQKTQRGWYVYPQGSRRGQEDPEVLAIVDAERRAAGVTPRSFSPQEIVRRYLAAMINEGANVVAEGIALRPLDVDVVLLNGYGFPRYRGGPMFYADQSGLAQALADIREFAREDAFFWRPSPLLVKLVESGRNFQSLNESSEQGD